MSAIAKLSDLVDPLLFDMPEHVTRFDRQTGRIVVVERGILSALEDGVHKEFVIAWAKANNVPYEDDTKGRPL